MSENTFIGNNHKIEINDPATKILFYEREINFLRQNIELKDKKIEATRQGYKNAGKPNGRSERVSYIDKKFIRTKNRGFEKNY